jgi:hypothetical protein
MDKGLAFHRNALQLPRKLLRRGIFPLAFPVATLEFLRLKQGVLCKKSKNLSDNSAILSGGRLSYRATRCVSAGLPCHRVSPSCRSRTRCADRRDTRAIAGSDISNLENQSALAHR